MLNILVIIITICFLFTGCSSNQSTNYDLDYHSSYSQNDYSDDDNEEEENDEDGNKDEDVSSSPLTFHGYTCTDDCSGHQAGYDWAEKKGITEPDDCSGKHLLTCYKRFDKVKAM